MIFFWAICVRYMPRLGVCDLLSIVVFDSCVSYDKSGRVLPFRLVF